MNKKVLVGVGVAGASGALAGLLFLLTKGKVKAAVAGEAKGGGRVKLKLTGYWPFSAGSGERKMEGGKTDRMGNPLHTLEQHLADPGKHPYVSLAGDSEVFPYGQRLIIPEFGDKAVCRVVDTGGHFLGANKLVRVAGYEPIDVCVDSRSSKLPDTVTATVVPGDNFAKGRAVSYASLTPGATVGLDEIGNVVLHPFIFRH